jgi:DNA-binding CsgD family transcriptional regulator
VEGEVVLTRGTRIVVDCEPVATGSQTIGAIMRLSLPRRADRVGGSQGSRRARIGWDSLSDAQLGVSQLVAAGLTNQQAARRLCVSPHTIDFHLRQVFMKLGINSRVDLTRIVTERRAEHDLGRETAA